MKRQGHAIPVVTAYDYTTAQIADRAGIPMLLVGDSLGVVIQGHTSTIPVTIDDMIYHTRAVVRGSQRALIIADMPFLTYTNEQQALHNAGRLLQEAGAQVVKLEGGKPVLPIVQWLVAMGVPVMGHLGYTPQSVHQIGQRVQGKHANDARTLINNALALEVAGACAIVLELVPMQLAAEITKRLTIPTIGIGAGPACDGQVQVLHDMLGLYNDFVPRHTRRYATMADMMQQALEQYAADVRDGNFPTKEHSTVMKEQDLRDALSDELG
jgi:3-methyl-2-oxobutanoate hydroxymethyltransferase